MYVQVDADSGNPAEALEGVPGVTRVAASGQSGMWKSETSIQAFEVESARGTDVRREIARTVVTRGWGLLELRPMRMSLEEIFLQVTTEEAPEEQRDEQRA
jgi:ABC-2 type transport system ATP-binding protein